jgi:hypothetical protein
MLRYPIMSIIWISHRIDGMLCLLIYCDALAFICICMKEVKDSLMAQDNGMVVKAKEMHLSMNRQENLLRISEMGK